MVLLPAWPLSEGNSFPPSSVPAEIRAVSTPWNSLLAAAQEEVHLAIQGLPDDLRPHAENLAVTYESSPGEGLLEEGWEPDLLGMFVGDAIDVGPGETSPVPRQIILFLENLWDFAEADEAIYREEVHVTYIHEFGHYLGLDEAELEARGLL
jgi:predicted Zn-dependent protease with MMP-like domain